MQEANFLFLIPASLFSFLIGITHIFLNDYLAGSVWILISTTAFLIYTGGITSLNQLQFHRPVEFFAFVSAVAFIILFCFQIYRDYNAR